MRTFDKIVGCKEEKQELIEICSIIKNKEILKAKEGQFVLWFIFKRPKR